MQHCSQTFIGQCFGQCRQEVIDPSIVYAICVAVFSSLMNESQATMVGERLPRRSWENAELHHDERESGPCQEECSSPRMILVLHVEETDRQCTVVDDESDMEHELICKLAQDDDRFF